MLKLKTQRLLLIKTEGIENIIVDEANERTYVIMAVRTLTDGELYRIIRLEILNRGSALARGERVVISASKWDKPRVVADSGRLSAN